MDRNKVLNKATKIWLQTYDQSWHCLFSRVGTIPTRLLSFLPNKSYIPNPNKSRYKTYPRHAGSFFDWQSMESFCLLPPIHF